MNSGTSDAGAQVGWFVGASFYRTHDQTARFLAEGIWEIDSPSDKDSALVKSMAVGDRIAIKAAYVRKQGLPFDNRGNSVSTMAIKAIGTITENLRDGEGIKVNWAKVDPVREWYFYTYRGTVWRVLPGEWKADGLLSFGFDGKPQDFERFRNAPYWRERFGSTAPDERRFGWTKFYEAIADKLLGYRNNRSTLVEGLRAISLRVAGLGHLAGDHYSDGTTGFVKDICPFTTMGLFNRGLKDSNRRIIAGELARLLGVTEDVPETFEGIPLLNNLASWYFPFETERAVDHIDALWRVFAAAIKFADPDDEDTRTELAQAFDSANGRPHVGWNLTIGLYWVRPWSFLSLDGNSRVYIGDKLGIPIGLHGPLRRCTAADYLAAMDTLDLRFQEISFPVHSYPDLSQEAWLYVAPPKEERIDVVDSDDEGPDVDTPRDPGGPIETPTVAPIVPYSVDDILKAGCFLERAEIDRLLALLRRKKNLILQGPPGTGKTWLAKRLAFALMGQKDDSKLRAMQFHPNLSYEDFVRGWRPTGDGRLSLADGVFMEAIKAGAKDPTAKVVVVIEEINRGNPAQIFGELLTLLEAGKRTPNEALELCYPDTDGSRRPVHIPENLYVIGTMNIADRSLALVDLALRRRFAFVSLEPRLGNVWRDWVLKECNIAPDRVGLIEDRIGQLNGQIASDARLGAQFRIGHSYVTPSQPLEAGETAQWFRQVVETEIGPLLEEYWFDAPEEAKNACFRLLQDW